MVGHMNETVYRVFEEFQKVLNKKRKFHPSEEVNRQYPLHQNSIQKIYDIISSYHSYCMVCCKHFYSQSVLNDINSFFEKHINSSYHRAHLMVDNYPDDKPILVWEKWLFTAHCNVCDLSDIEACVIIADFTPTELARIHKCFYEKDYRENNQKLVKKIELLRKFCGLNHFVNKVIVDHVSSNSVVCLMCASKKSGSVKSYQYHLFSDEHFQNFCKIIRNYFNFSIIDLLNGFNLQLVTEWLLDQKLNNFKRNFEICKDRENCLLESNYNWNPYEDVKRNSSFSPKFVENLLKFNPYDLIFDIKCLVCDVTVGYDHMMSDLHLKRAASTNMEHFEKSQKYQIYLRNREKRLFPYFGQIYLYRKLESELAMSGLQMGRRHEPEFNSFPLNYVRNLNQRDPNRKLWVETKELSKNSNHNVELINKKQALKKNAFTEVDGSVLVPEETLSQVTQENTCGSSFDDNADLKEHFKACADKNAFDFNNFQKVFRNVMDVFEDKIIQKVADNSGGSLGKIVKSNAPNTEKNTTLIDGGSKYSNGYKSSSPITNSQTDEVKTVKEKPIQILKREKDASSGIEDVKKEHNVEKTEAKNEEQNFDEEHEVLLINGIKDKMKKMIFYKFKKYGKIKYIRIEGNSAVLAFITKGSAEAALNGPPILLNKKPLELILTTKVSQENKDRKSESLKKDLEVLLENPKNLMDFIMSLVEISKRNAESDAEILREKLVCDTIISAVKPYFPFSKCHPFGSRLSGLTLNNSDFDVFLDCDNMYEGYCKTDLTNKKNLVNIVGFALRKVKDCTHLVVVDRARVPIVSFLHYPTQLHCDLSFKNGLSVQNTFFLKFMVSLDWRVKALVLFLKHWAKSCGLHGSPHFSSYGIALLVIFYMQQLPSPILPPIETLQRNFKGRRLTIEGWDCNFSTDVSIIKNFNNTDPLPKILLGFFQFYASFDYGKYIICSLMGKPVDRKAFCDSTEVKLPECILRHIINLPSPLSSLVRDDIPICIMDPFDLSHILTKSFTTRGLASFIRFCEISAAHLKAGCKETESC